MPIAVQIGHNIRLGQVTNRQLLNGLDLLLFIDSIMYT